MKCAHLTGDTIKRMYVGICTNSDKLVQTVRYAHLQTLSENGLQTVYVIYGCNYACVVLCFQINGILKILLKLFIQTDKSGSCR